MTTQDNDALPEGGEIETPQIDEMDLNAVVDAAIAQHESPPQESTPAEPAPEDVEFQWPDNWPKDYREPYKAAPEEVRAAWEGHVKDVLSAGDRRASEYEQDRAFAKDVRELFTPEVESQLQAAGMTPVQGVGHLLKLHNMATADPAGYVRWVADQAGLKPDDIFGTNEQQTGQADPRYAQISTELGNLKQQLSSFTEAEQQRSINQANVVLQEFQDERNEAGEPLHPHFEALEAEIGQILQSDPSLADLDMRQKLEKAYEKAVWGNSDIRTQMIEAEALKKAEASRKAADVEKAKRAKAPQSSPSTGTAPAGNVTLDQAISEALGS